MVSILCSDTTSLEDRSDVEKEFLILFLLLDSAEEAESEDFSEPNLFLESEKAGLAEPVLDSSHLSDHFS